MTDSASAGTDRDIEDPRHSSRYCDDRELHRRLAPYLGVDRFRAAILELELKGFPKVKSLWRGRSWPAVCRWLDNYDGVGTDALGDKTEDGAENFDAAQGRQARLQARAPQAALLDRQPGRAGSHAVPRPLHSTATRRG